MNQTLILFLIAYATGTIATMVIIAIAECKAASKLISILAVTAIYMIGYTIFKTILEGGQ